MVKFSRSNKNPILIQNEKSIWEARAAFNPSTVSIGKKYYMLYRAVSTPQERQGFNLEISPARNSAIVTLMETSDGINYKKILVTDVHQLMLWENQINSLQQHLMIQN